MTNDPERLGSEKLVAIHKADGEVEANLVVGLLRECGIEAAWREAPLVPPLDTAETMTRGGKTGTIYVMEHEAERARTLIREYQAGRPDDATLDEMASHKPPIDKETIGELRHALQEERQTFDFLGWVFVAFFGAMALLWMIWPDWLKTPVPTGGIRWLMVILLAVAAAVAANRVSRGQK